MILNLILLLLIPAAFITGGFVAIEIMCRIDCGVAIEGDDRGFFDGWETGVLQGETPFNLAGDGAAYDQETDPRPDEATPSAGYVTDVHEALALVRPKPYPPLRSVKP